MDSIISNYYQNPFGLPTKSELKTARSISTKGSTKHNFRSSLLSINKNIGQTHLLQAGCSRLSIWITLDNPNTALRQSLNAYEANYMEREGVAKLYLDNDLKESPGNVLENLARHWRSRS